MKTFKKKTAVRLKRYNAYSRSYTKGNPLFRRPRARKVRSAAFFWSLLSIAGVGAIIYAVFISPLTSLDTVRVSGATEAHAAAIHALSGEYLSERHWGIVPQRNVFFFDHRELERRIMESVLTASVVVQRNGLDLVEVAVVELVPRFTMINDSKTFLASEQGIVIEEISPDTAQELTGLGLIGFLSATTTLMTATGTIPQAPALPAVAASGSPRYPAVILAEPASLQPRSQALAEEVLRSITSTITLLSSFGIEARAILLSDKKATECSIRTNEGWLVLLDTSPTTIDAELRNLKAALLTTLRDRGTLHYVDLRFGNRVYYK